MCVNRQIEIMTVRKRKKFLMQQNIIDSVLSQLLAIELIKNTILKRRVQKEQLKLQKHPLSCT
jgi:hypothetical protein